MQLAAKFIVEEDDEAMQKELREAFRLYDKQGNGYIPTSCLREILRELDDQLTNEELDIMIEEIDSDGSGTVDFDGKYATHYTLSAPLVFGPISVWCSCQKCFGQKPTLKKKIKIKRGHGDIYNVDLPIFPLIENYALFPTRICSSIFSSICCCVYLYLFLL